MKFWDSCALVPLCIDEPFTGTVRTIAEEDEGLVAWWGTPVECCSAFARYRRENKISVDEERVFRSLVNTLAESWIEISPSEEARSLASRLLLRHPLRAADSLQLAAAVIWADKQPEGFEFVCLDKRLREAAQAEGFTVVPSQQTFDALCS
jgi:predicted nucleic acid-binding protein